MAKPFSGNRWDLVCDRPLFFFGSFRRRRHCNFYLRLLFCGSPAACKWILTCLGSIESEMFILHRVHIPPTRAQTTMRPTKRRIFGARPKLERLANFDNYKMLGVNLFLEPCLGWQNRISLFGLASRVRVLELHWGGPTVSLTLWCTLIKCSYDSWSFCRSHWGKRKNASGLRDFWLLRDRHWTCPTPTESLLLSGTISFDLSKNPSPWQLLVLI